MYVPGREIESPKMQCRSTTTNSNDAGSCLVTPEVADPTIASWIQNMKGRLITTSPNPRTKWAIVKLGGATMLPGQAAKVAKAFRMYDVNDRQPESEEFLKIRNTTIDAFSSLLGEKFSDMATKHISLLLVVLESTNPAKNVKSDSSANAVTNAAAYEIVKFLGDFQGERFQSG